MLLFTILLIFSFEVSQTEWPELNVVIESFGQSAILSSSPNGRVLVSSSLDGTVRAFDMARYRNFKTVSSKILLISMK